MIQTYGNTDELCKYEDFREQSRIKVRRTERAQRREIDEGLAKLTEQRDYWSLDLIRRALAILTNPEEEKAGNELYFIIREVIEAKPGEWIIRCKEA